LLLACLGIAYLEFLGRRLNGPNQLDEGLGIRVVGTLPPLNARRMMNPKHPLVAQLTESIDSVRTALMHDSTSKARQVVLVTSPASKEGRTTVASQLAASLARAGRRTLLIDGDLRHPALHLLFDVPLEDGLCEVLRAEADVTDVVRPTHAEGLWLMTAGYCDADAVHAMATDQIQPIFEKLRSEYDFVIIDGAPVLGLSDSLMMGQHCDGALLSVLRDQTSVPSIYKASELLRDVGVRLIGSVVNGVTAKADRRVTHLQVASPKAARKQLEAQTKGAAAATATKPVVDELDDLDDLDFSDLSDDKN
jgi:succinoglycan biosynthesis transport protein ExoP